MLVIIIQVGVLSFDLNVFFFHNGEFLSLMYFFLFQCRAKVKLQNLRQSFTENPKIGLNYSFGFFFYYSMIITGLLHGRMVMKNGTIWF